MFAHQLLQYSGPVTYLPYYSLQYPGSLTYPPPSANPVNSILQYPVCVAPPLPNVHLVNQVCMLFSACHVFLGVWYRRCVRRRSAPAIIVNLIRISSTRCAVWILYFISANNTISQLKQVFETRTDVSDAVKLHLASTNRQVVHKFELAHVCFNHPDMHISRERWITINLT